MNKRAADFSDVSFQKRSRLSDDFSASGDPMYRRSSLGALSPHGSPRSLSSAEIAADFQDALQYLKTNNRAEIDVLTMIAKENTEHAQAISKVLEDHIRKTAPNRKLPALYVLDSIVKNVGTPFTIYLGQNLYKTFMEAYTLVDLNTRKSLEGLLKTWKEPIPGSLETRPVFPVDTVKPIDNALIKIRTLSLQQQQDARLQRPVHALPPRPVGMTPQQDWNRTGTPPVMNGQYPLPPTQQHDPRFGTPSATPQYNYGFPPAPYPPPQQTPVPPQYGYPGYPPQQQATPAPPPSAPAQNAYSLVALLQASGTYTPTPQPAQAVAPPPPPMHAPVPPPPAGFPGLDALFKLPGFQQGAPPQAHLPQPPPLPQPPSTAYPAMPNLAALLAQAQAQPAAATTPSLPFSTLSAPASSTTTSKDVQLNAASLKVPRPHLIQALYPKESSQCLTCGRRFSNDAEGKARKARHLDAHFHRNVKLQDSQRTGISRSWYINEMEWLRFKEQDDADEDVDSSGNAAGSAGAVAITSGDSDGPSSSNGQTNGSGAKANANDYYVKAPADAAVGSYACPICQEEFKTTYLDKAQDWVWMDAVAMNGKTYHASCVMDMAKDRGNEGIKAEIKRE